jgi:HEAT repeat protein
MRTYTIPAVLLALLGTASTLAAQGGLGGSTGSEVGKKSGGGGDNTGPGDTVSDTGGRGGNGSANAPAPLSAPPSAPRGAPSQPRGVATARELLAALDPTSWDLWWAHNRDPYLALSAALDRIHPRTRSEAQDDELVGRRAGVTRKELYGEVVPVLAKALAGTQDERVVRTTLLALARIGEAPVSSDPAETSSLRTEILGYLSSADRAIAETAVIALGVLGSSDAIRDLVELARDTAKGRELCAGSRVPLRMRALATYGIGISSSFLSREEVSHYAVWHLCALLRDDGLAHPDLQAACVIALGLAPLAGRAPAVASYEERPSRSRADEIEYLLGLFRDTGSPSSLRAHAPAALARLAQGADDFARDRVLSTLIEAIDPEANEPSEVRTGCMLALGALADCDADLQDFRAREALVAAVARHDAMERDFAVLSLGQVAARPGRSGATPFAGIVESSSFLLATLEAGKSRSQPWAALGMGLLGHGLRSREVAAPAGFARALGERIATTNVPEDAAAYAVAAGLLGDVEVRPAIEASLERFRDDHWRAHLAVALGLLGDPAALPALASLSETSPLRPELFESSAIARALLGDRELVPMLLERLADTDSWTELQSLSLALGWTGDGRALAPLLEALQSEDRTDAERSFLIDALGRIGDKERVNWSSRLSSGLNYPAATQTLSDPWGLGILDAL